MGELDFSIISNDSLAVVHCPTQEKAKHFLECLQANYPTKHLLSDDGYWEIYKTDTCYWPEFGRPGDLSYGSLQYAMKNNYHVYNFDELCIVRDFSIDDYEVDIKSLIGLA